LSSDGFVWVRKCPMSWKDERYVSVHRVCFACNYWLGCKNNKPILIRKEELY